jgi:predicted GH43/DUF377 family glycosyl hydrolase
MAADLAVRTKFRLNPDARRVIARLFVPGEETPHGRSREHAVLSRILDLDDADVTSLVSSLLADYCDRHHDLGATLAAHFDVIANDLPESPRISRERQTLIGAYFTHEYSTESAALFNPSMAPHPDQSHLSEGQLRFIMTVRCVGEGHISSIGFRTGVVGPGSDFAIDEPEPRLRLGASRPGTLLRRRLFLSKLAEHPDLRDEGHALVSAMNETFTPSEFSDALGRLREHTLNRDRVQRAIEFVHHVAMSTYDLEFPSDSELTERLLWPVAPAESHGMEDARLVRFDEGGAATYYATYTAYDGASVCTHLLATKDFLNFHVSPMAGRAAQNKGLALFPRHIGGRYFALSRWDRENLALVDSDDCRIWEQPTLLRAPRQGWELIQIGNGGSPIETPQGWLVLTHGVGPMRSYALGAMLLDLDDPSVVLASLPHPLLSPNSAERDGYVPNVVYTCGALLHAGVLTIPYGISDGAIGFAQVAMSDLLSQMTSDHG